MRIAVLSDPHGNVAALRAVLSELEREAPDEIVYLGDLAAGPFPAETVALARSTAGARHVRGNWDDVSRPAPAPYLQPALDWVADRLGDDDRAWLAAQPPSLSLDGTLFVHATPLDDTSLVTERTSAVEAETFVDGVAEPRVVAGHLHVQFARRIGEVDWTCVGSIGQPTADEPGAYWAVVEDGTVDLRRTAYDVEAAAASFGASGHPLAGELAATLVRPTPPAVLLDRLHG